VVACSFIVLRGVCIAVVCVIFGPFSPSTCFGGMVVHFAVCAFVLGASVSLSASWSATLSAMTTAALSTR